MRGTSDLGATRYPRRTPGARIFENEPEYNTIPVSSYEWIAGDPAPSNRRST